MLLELTRMVCRNLLWRLRLRGEVAPPGVPRTAYDVLLNNIIGQFANHKNTSPTYIFRQGFFGLLPTFLVLFVFGPGFVDLPVGVSVTKIIRAEGRYLSHFRSLF
jgi:hypothetical protein